ncbi:uv radiation resistance protein [Pyrenophora tritici-repentis]|uniref:Autophagy-related protein 14 n=1 Tax=Pyrenophora tritici-repentis TaxID=45151 RepID=A0A2W1HM10_9PLEO|nr:uv radiation resistance protein [Pyrenophora tritici-repentis]KAF7450749.1 uv radiation resistance protein [Pyrenophora tritici-repentis]KAG9381036.1 uv radiation resistance protein [Pyrenophora tritici-repentis]KAI0573430.1 uv radiation resistance protein [Pyrenophora tritici-repentis]KAI0576760.1 uv radiation resistance protein [Pyrenophora tritici-repentis]
MAGEQSQAAGQPESRPPRERPWLLPYNRKLRHLQGITLRNLTLTPNPPKSRGKTIDDEAIPSTLKSPTKALAQRDTRGLAHSRSSSHLNTTDDNVRRSNGGAREPGTTDKAPRPGYGTGPRRRSTLEWANSSPLTRQKKLQDMTAGRMADTFFSLHIEGHDDPVYISEVAEKAMNPNFKFFDLASCGPGVTRLDKLTVKVWAKTETMQDWQYLIDYTVQFRSLQFIGKTLGGFRHPLPQNCILFHMADGIYTSFTDLPVEERTRPELLAPPKENPDGRVLTSSSYDALMRLSTLDDCIQDALTTRDRIADEIESILAANKEDLCTVESVAETEESLRTVQAAVTAEKRRVVATRRKRDELQASIQHRQDLMRLGRLQQSEIDAKLPEERAKCTDTKQLLEKTAEDITGQRRRVCEDILRIFPIEPVPGKALAFTIRGLLLPNSVFDDAKEEVTSAALGYVAQIVNLLSLYLSVILPYPLSVHGSTSTIDDPLAVTQNNQNHQRTYPLYMKNVVRYRFEYGVFLLNKDVEILSNSLGLRPVDIRHTLPNLKYLLYVATAGKGELPARKAGGIRGLLRQDGVLSRTGSMDSTITASSIGTPTTELKRSLEIAGKKIEHTKPNGTLAHSLGGLQHKTVMHTGSRLRP